MRSEDQSILRRVQVEAHDVANLVDEQRIVGQLERLRTVRCQREGRQIREMADCDMPVAAAIDPVDQWVAFFGFSSAP